MAAEFQIRQHTLYMFNKAGLFVYGCRRDSTNPFSKVPRELWKLVYSFIDLEEWFEQYLDWLK